MNKKAIFPADRIPDLPNCFYKRERFDVADRTAYFRNNDVAAGLLRRLHNAALNLVGNMRDNLYGRSAIVPSPFMIQNGKVYFSGRVAIEFMQSNIGEPFVMAEIEVGFSAVLRYKNFSMLIGVHRPRIDIQIRIKLLIDNRKPSAFQQKSDRCGGNAFPKGRNNPAGNKNKTSFHHARHYTTLRALPQSTTPTQLIHNS